MTKLSVPMKNSVRGPRATAPVHFAKFSVFRWWFVALVLGVIVDTVQAKDYFSNPVRRSCVCGNYKSKTDYFEHKVFPDDAKFWDVKYKNSYKILTDKQHNRRTFLYLCGTPVPGSAEGVKSGDQVVEIPIKRASVDSSTMFPYFEYIGQRTSITHGSTYATSPCMQKHVRNGNVATGPVGDSDVDFAFVSKYSWDNAANGDASYYNKPVFVLDAANEAKALGQLEYTKLVSLFFNREEAAKDIDTYVEKRMVCHKKAVKNKKKMKVAIVSLLQISGNTNCNKFTQNTMVSVRKCPHPNCDVLKATNAKLLTNFPKGSFSLKTFVKKARKADVLIIQANLASPGFYDSSNGWAYTPISGECLDQFNKAIKSTKAGKNGNVYDIYKTKSVAGATAFFEGLNAEPDVAMLDLLSALRPNDYGDHERVFYRKAWGDDAESVTVLSHTDCDDVDDPLYNAWTKKACKSETQNVVVRGLGKVKNSDVC